MNSPGTRKGVSNRITSYIVAGIVAGALMLASPAVIASLPTIYVDFGPSATPTASFSSLSTTTPTTIGGVTFGLGGASFLDRGAAGASNGGAFTYANLYNDFAYTNGGTGDTTAPTLTLTLANLMANTSYDIRFYSSDFFSSTTYPVGSPWAGKLQTTYTATVGSGSTISSTFDRTLNPTSNQQNSVLGSFTSDGSGVLKFDIVGTSLDGGQAFTRLNGMEVTVTAVPEPEIYAMMGVGLGLLGWIGRRKKLKEAAAA